jgi:hypothetical protein
MKTASSVRRFLRGNFAPPVVCTRGNLHGVCEKKSLPPRPNLRTFSLTYGCGGQDLQDLLNSLFHDWRFHAYVDNITTGVNYLILLRIAQFVAAAFALTAGGMVGPNYLTLALLGASIAIPLLARAALFFARALAHGDWVVVAASFVAITVVSLVVSSAYPFFAPGAEGDLSFIYDQSFVLAISVVTFRLRFVDALLVCFAYAACVVGATASRVALGDTTNPFVVGFSLAHVLACAGVMAFVARRAEWRDRGHLFESLRMHKRSERTQSLVSRWGGGWKQLMFFFGLFLECVTLQNATAAGCEINFKWGGGCSKI